MRNIAWCLHEPPAHVHACSHALLQIWVPAHTHTKYAHTGCVCTACAHTQTHVCTRVRMCVCVCVCVWCVCLSMCACFPVPFLPLLLSPLPNVAVSLPLHVCFLQCMHALCLSVMWTHVTSIHSDTMNSDASRHCS